MAVNKYFNQTRNVPEQSLYSSLVIETIQIWGVDVLYIKRDNLSIDPVLREPTMSTFKDTHSIEMYIPNSDTSQGDQYFMNKLGISFNEIAEAYVSIDRWDQVAGRELTRPREGDLIYVGNPQHTHGSFINKMYQIKNVSVGHPENGQFGKNHTYRLVLEIFTSSYETFETSINDIDADYNIDIKNEFLTAINQDSVKIAQEEVMEQTENPFGENYKEGTQNKPFGTDDYVNDTPPKNYNPFGDIF